MEEDDVYCKWVNATVKMKDIPASCKEFVKNGRCIVCVTSPQIELGMSPDELLRNIR